MAEYGFEVSQRGVNIESAAEWQKVASSKWKYLPVLKRGYFIIQPGGAGEAKTIFEHNLGYLTPFLIFQRNDRGGWQELSLTSIYNSRTKLYITDGQLTTVELYYIVFDYNLDQETPQDIGKVGSDAGSGSIDQGIKAVKIEKFHNQATIVGNDYRKFSFHTGAKGMSVHLSGNRVLTTDNPIVRVEHNLGYLTTYLFYFYLDGTTGTRADTIQLSDNIARDDTKTLTLQGAQVPLLGKYYYIILKEPFATSI